MSAELLTKTKKQTFCLVKKTGGEKYLKNLQKTLFTTSASVAASLLIVKK